MSRVQLKDGYCGKQKVLVFAEETRWQLSDLMVQERQRLLKIVHGNPGISLSPSVKIGYFSQK